MTRTISRLSRNLLALAAITALVATSGTARAQQHNHSHEGGSNAGHDHASHGDHNHSGEVLAFHLPAWKSMRLIILPQALKIVIPPSVSVLISAFKDTSLVVIIALFDFLKTTKTVLNDPQWMGFSAEAYIFAALIYFLCCFFMSNYSRRLERELERGL